MSSLFLILSVVLMLGPAQPARSVTILETSRSVLASASYFLGGSLTDDDADDFQSDMEGSFLEAANAAVNAADMGFASDVANASGQASQDSQIDVSALGALNVEASGSGTASSMVMADGGPSSSAAGTGDTELSITFSVDQASAYSIDLSLSADLSELKIFPGIFGGDGSLQADLVSFARLTGTSTGIVFDREVQLSSSRTSDEGLTSLDNFVITDGILAPDTYLLELYTSSSASGFEEFLATTNSSFEVSFTVPEPAAGVASLAGLGAMAVIFFLRRRST